MANSNIDKTKSGLLIANFDKIIDGKKTSLFVLKNSNGSEVAILNYGARIVSLVIPNKNGNWVDVVTGHNTIDEYINSEEPYFGATCGRTANRIAKGKFTLEGKEYTLATNNGPNCLHGGVSGFNTVIWDAKQLSDQSIELSYLSKDGEEGFPGNLKVTVTYTLTDNNSVDIKYEATTDKTTILNLTNHSYFNLSGAGDNTIHDHLLTIDSDYYLPTDDTAIPYGKAEKVSDTPMDFRKEYTIGSRIKEQFEQLLFARGYDHTYILNKKERTFAHVAKCYSPKTNIQLDVYTDQPGMQVYTGNWMTGDFVGKNGQRYPSQSAVCFETQHYPDSINHPDYPSIVLKPKDKFESKTIFEFSIHE